MLFPAATAVFRGERAGNPSAATQLPKAGLLLCCLLFSVGRLAAAEPTSEQIEFFETRIRPLLSEHCFKCHSSTSEKLKGGLLLDSHEGLLKGGDAGPVITPEAPERSKIIEAINYENPDLQMPPKGKLKETQIKDLTKWVMDGAVWGKESPNSKTPGSVAAFDLEKRRREHWAWHPIRQVAVPNPKNKSWASTIPDRFILARLEQNELRPAPPADKNTLLRRLYFDLIGLPPSPGQLHKYLNNSAPDAYEKEVDELLASPHFGERWARHWLDLVRYAETLGHEFDYPIHNAWRYRDYVIRAFNADVPYDQFVTEHIAGDLITHPRQHPSEHFNESVIGTAFYWLGQRDHSPVDVRQHQAEVIDNQIDVLSKTFLGVTVACARCHDHKFDAISTKDYYSLYGILEGARYCQQVINPPNELEPEIEKLKQLKTQIQSELVSDWSKQSSSLFAELTVASTNNTSIVGKPRNIGNWSTALTEQKMQNPEHLLYPLQRFYSVQPKTTVESQELWSQLLQIANDAALTNAGKARPDLIWADAGNDTFNNWFADGEAFRNGIAQEGDFLINRSNQPIRIMAEPVINDAGLSRRLEGAFRSPSFIIEKRFVHVLAGGTASRIRACVDNFTMIRDPIYGGLVKYVDSNTLAWHTFDVEMWKGHRMYFECLDTAAPDPADDAHKTYGSQSYIALSKVIFSDEPTPPPANARSWTALIGSEPVESCKELISRYERAYEEAVDTFATAKGPFTPKQEAQLAFLDWLSQNNLLTNKCGVGEKSLINEYCRIESSIPERERVPGMVEGDGVDEHIFIRGNHKIPGEPAPRAFLSALGGTESTYRSSGSGRLELAKSMTAESDPLLARVMVNRVWLHLFGRGIVPTPDDFGALGQEPSHPELLDWLAQWYRTEARWSTKSLIRMLVTSSTYRMSSRADDSTAEQKDPSNILFHRMPIRRLEGEAIRDSILTVSGQLNDKMFGPSVPIYLTEFMEGRGRPTKSGPLDGEGRRTIYLEVRRNFLAPMMRTFDAPVPFSTIGRRTVSNVPAQSLILMNDPFVLEEAGMWAGRMLKASKSSAEERMLNLYEAAYARAPTKEERASVIAFISEQGQRYGLTAEEAKSDLRVWTDLCHVAFNVKEFIYLK